MKDLPAWDYDEMKHIGVDYADPAVAAGYDAHHQQFRGNLAAEADRLLDALQIEPRHVLLDIGCGTGSFAVQAAHRCAFVYAVDVSPAMLEAARLKAETAAVHNIAFAQGGFLKLSA